MNINHPNSVPGYSKPVPSNQIFFAVVEVKAILINTCAAIKSLIL
jgi:hypothetical protein